MNNSDEIMPSELEQEEYSWSDEEWSDDENQEVTKYKNYTEIKLQLAICDIKDGNFSIRESSKYHNIPKSTLSDHLNSKKNDPREIKIRGPKRVLTDYEEEELEQWLVECAKRGCPKTKDDLSEAASAIRQSRISSKSPNFKNNIPTDKWIKGFLKRHPKVSFRTPELLSRAAANVSENTIRNFFASFHKYLEDNNMLEVLNRPEAFMNIDETSFAFNPKHRRILAEKGTKCPYDVESGKSKQNITVTYCFSAEGKMLTTQVIYKNNFTKLHEAAYAAGRLNTDILFSQTNNGWQDKHSFESYIKRLVEDLKNVEKPVFLTFDNHPSHINYMLFKMCKEQGVHILTFPPNTTHILQMADVSMFGPAKAAWRKEVNRWKRVNSEDLNEVSFINVLHSMNLKVMTSDNIKAGFKATGLYPFNVENVHFERCIGENKENNEEQIDDCYSAPLKRQKTNEGASSSYSTADKSEGLIDSDKVGLESKTPMESMTKSAHVNSDDSYPEKLIREGKAIAQKLFDYYQSYNHDEAMFSAMNIKREFNILTNIIPTCSEFATSTDHTNSMSKNVIKSSDKYSKPINEILEIPNRYQRTTIRHYKRPNCGVMSSNEVLENYEQLVEEKQKLDDAKKERKALREQKKLLRTIKKESPEQNDTNEVKKRGRPPKRKI